MNQVMFKIHKQKLSTSRSEEEVLKKPVQKELHLGLLLVLEMALSPEMMDDEGACVLKDVVLFVGDCHVRTHPGFHVLCDLLYALVV